MIGIKVQFEGGRSKMVLSAVE